MFRKPAVALLVFAVFAAPVSVSAGRHQDSYDERMKEIRSQVKAGKAQAVVYELESMTKKDPKDAQVWMLLSKVYTDLDFSGNMMNKAIGAAQKAVEAEPNNSTCLKTLAELHARKGHFKEALALLDKAMAQKVVDPFVYKTRALVLSETKRDKEAAIYWDKFVALNPRATTNLNSLDGGVMIYSRAGMTEKAIAWCDKAYALTSNDTWVMKKAEAYTLGGRMKEAIEVYSKLIAHQPDDELALLERSRLYSKLGKDKEALADMDAAIKELPTTSMYLERAKIYDRLGNAKMAKRDRDRAQSPD